MRLPRSVVLITALSKSGTGVGGRHGGCCACATPASARSAAVAVISLVCMGTSRGYATPTRVPSMSAEFGNSTTLRWIRIEKHRSLALVEAHAEMLEHVQPSEQMKADSEMD